MGGVRPGHSRRPCGVPTPRHDHAQGGVVVSVRGGAELHVHAPVHPGVRARAAAAAADRVHATGACAAGSRRAGDGGQTHPRHAAWPKCPGPRQPLRPPTAPETRPPAEGCPLLWAQREPSQLGRRGRGYCMACVLLRAPAPSLSDARDASRPRAPCSAPSSAHTRQSLSQAATGHTRPAPTALTPMPHGRRPRVRPPSTSPRTCRWPT